MPTRFVFIIFISAFSFLGLQDAPAQETTSPANGKKVISKAANPAEIELAASKGIEFLRQRGQGDDGAFSPESGAAVTGLCVRAILEHRPQAISDPVIKRALKFLESKIQSDGGIYTQGSKHRNYETSVAVGALIKANQDGQYDSVLDRAELFLKGLQWDEDEGASPKDPAYGGAGYGSHERPDLSNTSFLIDALRDLGNDANDQAIQKALLFVKRTQNLPGHGNDTPHANSVGDGGFYYTPAAGGESQAGETDGGGLRSYGSMTYAGLKSMIYAGLSADDPRVIAAMNFIRKHYSLTENPGMGHAGQFYYYHTFAKSLNVAEIDILDDSDGKPHDWRSELGGQLIAMQQADGSWVNQENDRWMEGDRQLVTAYALLALANCK
ncbi:MAG: prenyltransferase/squalene oxidase repeat-containing protein [Rubripirellula sp.]